MKRASGTFLGISVTERGFSIAEATSSAITQTAQWQSPGTLPGMSPEDLATAGNALKQFLKQHNFSATKTIIGFPAKWITARPWPVPPSASTAAHAILRLAAERQFPPELKDFTFDYAGETSATEQTSVLLAGTSQQRIAQIIQIAEKAGLNVQGITSTTLALAVMLPRDKKILVAVSPDGTELVTQSDAGPRSLRHLSVAGEQLISSNGSSAPALAMLGSELMRASLAQGNSELLLWDSAGLRRDSINALRERYNLNLSAATDLSGVPVQASEFGPAAALALVGARGEELPLDFLHPRLAPPKENLFGKKVYWGIAVAVLLIVVIGSYFYSINQQQAQLDQMNQELHDEQPRVVNDKATEARMAIADQWYATRPSMLNCLNHVTAAFPQEGVIWATQISMRDNGMGTVTGRSRDQFEPLAVYDRMKNDHAFSKVVVNDIRQGTGNTSRTWTFSISFTFAL
ncbi:MAG TPA: hypothetical protein VGG19_01270 [Tepidisphaeraceae bacterium]